MSKDFLREMNDTSIGVQEKTRIYDKRSTEYDQVAIKFKYTAPRRCCETICSYVSKNGKYTVILDVGAGTGLLGQELYKEGFRTIDALDPSQGMLNEAQKKGIYRKFFCSFLTSDPLDILKSDSYDVVTSTGCFNPGHLPHYVVIEMIRITKPGGLVCLNCRTEHVNTASEFAQFFPLCDQLEKDGKWKREGMTVYDGYLRNVEGLILVYRVL